MYIESTIPSEHGRTAAYCCQEVDHIYNHTCLRVHEIKQFDQFCMMHSALFILNNGSSHFTSPIFPVLSMFTCFSAPLGVCMPVVCVLVAQSVTKSGPLWTSACEYGKFTILALRLSENMYTGRGTTDTGNCLYNTTCLE